MIKSYLDILTLKDNKTIIPATIASFIEIAFSILPAMLTFKAIEIITYKFVAPEKFNIDTLKWIAFGMIISVVLQYIIGIFSYKVTNIKTYEKSASTRKAYVRNLIAHPLGFFNKEKVNRLSISFANDFKMSEIVLSYYLPQVFALITFMLLIVVGLFSYEWRLALALFVPLPFVIITFLKASSMKTTSQVELHEIKEKVNHLLTDYISGMKILRNFNTSKDLENKLNDSYDELKEASIKNETGAGTLSYISINLVSLAIPSMSLIAAFLLTNGQLLIKDYVALLVFATKVTVPMTLLLICLLSLRTQLIVQGRLNDIVSYEPVKRSESITSGVIEFKNVSFAYDKCRVIDDISFKVKPKTFTALVGPSGCGKTTITKLITNFYDTQTGSITMSGNDISKVSSESLLSHMTMVSQNPYLFNMSIKDNVAYGNPDTPLDEIIKVCKEANCHDFIMEMKNGYDTLISEGGLSLSGGERQRVGIARALLKDADIVILDEPTSSLDFENEYMVQQAINRLIKDKTVIMISHRLNTIVKADQIIVLNEGKVSNIGTHDVLFNSDDVYTNLINHSLVS